MRAIIKRHDIPAEDKDRIFTIYDLEYGARFSSQPILSNTMIRVFRYGLRCEDGAVSNRAWDMLVELCPRSALSVFKKYAESDNDKRRLDANLVLAYAARKAKFRKELELFLKHPDKLYRKRAARALYELWDNPDARSVLGIADTKKKEFGK